MQCLMQVIPISDVIQFFDLNYLIKEGIPKVDYHMHTQFSDGIGSIQEYLQSAENRGLTSFAITDHVWKTSYWLDDYFNEIDSVRESSSIKIFSGVEAKQININGEIDLDSKYISKLDLVLGAVHALPTDTDYLFIDPNKLSPIEILEVETESIISLIRNKQVKIIAHPFIMYQKYVDSPVPYEAIEKVVNCAVKNNVAIELNGKYSLPGIDFLKLALKSGAKLSFGSDAHKPSDIGKIPYCYVEQILEDLS